MKLSVVIPVYNVLSTLIRCVDSVVLQNVDSMELILVDDGSTDGSSALCDNIRRQYADDTCSIQVIHQPNAGLSAARNAGVKIATGDLITFVDSDDFIEKETYDDILPIFEKDEEVDVVEYPVDRFYNVVTRREELVFSQHSFDNALDYLFQSRAAMHAYAWNKVYRLSRLRPEGEERWFEEGRTFEDVFALPYWLSKARKVATTDRGCYFYTLNTDGICHTSGWAGHNDRFEALVALMQWIPNERRSGKAYCQIYEQALNARKDAGKRTSLPASVTPPWTSMTVKCLLKHFRYLMGR